MFDAVLSCCCNAVCSRVLWIGNVRHTSEIDLKAKLAQFGQASISVSNVLFRLAFFLSIDFCALMRYRDGAGNTVEENSSVFSLIRMR